MDLYYAQSADLALTEVIDDNSKLEQRITLLENTIKNLEVSNDKKQDEIDGTYVVVLPITIIGGAGKLSDITDLVSECGIVGCGVGSLFVFKGPYKAVLISYQKPNL